MNGENSPLDHTSALNQAQLGRETMPVRAWRWIMLAQLGMVAAFVGMSLLVIAASSWFYGGAGHGPDELLAMALGGGLLVALALRGVSSVLQRAERELAREGGDVAEAPRHTVDNRFPPALAKMNRITPTL